MGGITMAVPRVFISSTYYDLKQVRNIVGSFISDLGYEPVMHERADVAYSQSIPLENDCYNEVASCDIIVCIIGNHFGTQASDNELSITMNEVMTAIKEKKKVYIFISNDVYIENRTFIQNKDTGTFKSAYTDNLKIHEFIEELKNSVRDHVIEPFDSTDDIVFTLKKQFAGLLQGLLQREASLTDNKTVYDLQETSDKIEQAVQQFQATSEDFFKRFEGTIFAANNTLRFIMQHLGITKASIYARDIDSLDEIMLTMQFYYYRVDDPITDIRKYGKQEVNNENEIVTRVFTLKKELFNSDGTLADIRGKDNLNKLISYQEFIQEMQPTNDDDAELPF